MQRKIFVSYRKSDSREIALTIAAQLEVAFGRKNVFIDVQSIQPGEEFDVVLRNTLEKCAVLVVVIGPGWAGATNAEGQKRLHLTSDWVRAEIETALQRGIHILPVLVGDAAFPAARDLPPSLAPLLVRQTTRISGQSIRSDVAGLVADIRSLKPTPRERRQAICSAVMHIAATGATVAASAVLWSAWTAPRPFDFSLTALCRKLTLPERAVLRVTSISEIQLRGFTVSAAGNASYFVGSDTRRKVEASKLELRAADDGEVALPTVWVDHRQTGSPYLVSLPAGSTIEMGEAGSPVAPFMLISPRTAEVAIAVQENSPIFSEINRLSAEFDTGLVIESPGALNGASALVPVSLTFSPLPADRWGTSGPSARFLLARGRQPAPLVDAARDSRVLQGGATALALADCMSVVGKIDSRPAPDQELYGQGIAIEALAYRIPRIALSGTTSSAGKSALEIELNGTSSHVDLGSTAVRRSGIGFEDLFKKPELGCAAVLLMVGGGRLLAGAVAFLTTLARGRV